MEANNGVSTNMGIVYVAPVQNKAGIHFMVNLSDHEVQCHNNKKKLLIIIVFFERSFCASTVKFNADFTKGTSY
jgi:hypothetical protein